MGTSGAVGGQNQIILYNTDNLECLGVLPFTEGIPYVLKFSRNGSVLLAGGGRGVTITGCRHKSAGMATTSGFPLVLGPARPAILLLDHGFGAVVFQGAAIDPLGEDIELSSGRACPALAASWAFRRA